MKQLEGRKILVVEDEFLVAMTLSEILEEAGAIVAGPFGRLSEALAFVETEGSSLDGAVLDVTLHGQTSYPIADVLIAHGVKFVFATGYDTRALDATYRGYPRCEKPYRPEALLTALTNAVS
jgi:two-component SAPR family response regulator